MKKSAILILGLCLLTVFSAQASIKFGVKGGVNLAKASFDADAIKPDNFTGFQVGVISEFTLPIIGLGMDAALLYSQQGVKFKKVDGIEDEDDVKTSSLNIPLNLKYKFSLVGLAGVYFTAGPYVSFKLSGDDFSFKSPASGLVQQYENKSFGAGLNFGAGVELLSHLQVGANYQLGLTDDYSSIGANSETLKGVGKTRIWSITAAYFF